MLKNKIKLSLVDDYVKLVIFENFFNSYNRLDEIDISNQQHKNSQLKKVYDAMFEKLHMNDCSLLLLKQQLKDNNNLSSMCNEENEHDLLEKVFDSINKIERELKCKMHTLKIDANELVCVCGKH